MVRIIENWADVDGVVEHVARRGDRTVYQLRVLRVREVPGFPNLIATETGRRIPVAVLHPRASGRPRTTRHWTTPRPIARAEPGTRVRLRVRKAGLDHYVGHDVSGPRSGPA